MQEREKQLRNMERHLLVPILYRYSKSGRTYFDLSADDIIREILWHELDPNNPGLLERTKPMSTLRMDDPEQQKKMNETRRNANPAKFSRVAAMCERELVELLLDENSTAADVLAFHLKWYENAGPMIGQLFNKYARQLFAE